MCEERYVQRNIVVSLVQIIPVTVAVLVPVLLHTTILVQVRVDIKIEVYLYTCKFLFRYRH